jgi:hypothetical protein
LPGGSVVEQIGSVYLDVSPIRHAFGERTGTIVKGSQLSPTLRQLNLLTPEIALVDTDYDFTGIQGVLPGVAVIDGVLNTRLKYVAVRRDRYWHFIAAQNTVVLPAPTKP